MIISLVVVRENKKVSTVGGVNLLIEHTRDEMSNKDDKKRDDKKSSYIVVAESLVCRSPESST